MEAPSQEAPQESSPPPPPSQEASGLGDVQVTLDAPPPSEDLPPAQPPVDESEGTAAMAAELVSGLFGIVGGEAQIADVPWALTDDEKKAFAADLAPLLRKYGMTAMPFPEEMRFGIRAAVTAGPRLMKFKKMREAAASAGHTPQTEEIARGNSDRGGEEGLGKVNAPPKAGLAGFAGHPTKL